MYIYLSSDIYDKWHLGLWGKIYERDISTIIDHT